MDLAAYAQIEDLHEIAKANGIEVPRLRGYRLMKDEEPVSAEELNKLMKDCEVQVCENLCCSIPFWSSKTNCRLFSSRTNYIRDYFLTQAVDEKGYKRYVGIRWDRIHGKKRKILKFAIKKQNKKIQKQFKVWNKYAGKEDVLYIHSRIGGKNWSHYGGDELATLPWFLEKVDDWFDGTYCDIYAVIKAQENLDG